MSLRTKSERQLYAITVAANTVRDFTDPLFRGPAWNEGTMRVTVERQARIASLMVDLSEQQRAEIVQMALAFYDESLAVVFDQLYAFQEGLNQSTDVGSEEGF